MLWVSLCDPMMIVHYKLFKYGTWYGHRVSDRVSVFDFCSDATTNVVVQALDSLAGILFEPEQQASLTGLLGLLGGDMGDWSAAAKQALHVSALLAFSRLWRKLYRFFQCYPWKLAPGFDVRRDEADRRKTVEQFLRASPCCLDEGFSQVLREHVVDGRRLSVDDFFGTLLEEFLIALFEQVVVTSTQVELMFSWLTKFTTANPQGIGHESLVGTCLTSQFARAVNRWRTVSDRVTAQSQTSGRHRQAWMFSPY